jgi:alkanesulfonate monooxygenase SsuD/methylene tetrahydromethanopterin reductase-like flavin-dependent oxidoreductase (luciferase family)
LGDPLFSDNAIQARDNYKLLIDFYREQHEAHGHDPRHAHVGAGSGFTYIADTAEQAKEEFGPIYEDIVKVFASRPGNATPYRNIEHAIAEVSGTGRQPAAGDQQDHVLPRCVRA